MKKKNIVIGILCLLFFTLGFFIHALFFPSLFSWNYSLGLKRVVEQTKPPIVNTTNKALTTVLFELGEFDPPVVVIGKSYYLAIRNNSEKELMTLTSSNSLFRTPRGYGLSEEHVVQLYEVGEYTVSSTLHPDRSLKVIVK